MDPFPSGLEDLTLPVGVWVAVEYFTKTGESGGVVRVTSHREITEIEEEEEQP